MTENNKNVFGVFEKPKKSDAEIIRSHPHAERRQIEQMVRDGKITKAEAEAMFKAVRHPDEHLSSGE